MVNFCGVKQEGLRFAQSAKRAGAAAEQRKRARYAAGAMYIVQIVHSLNVIEEPEDVRFSLLSTF